MSKHPQRYVVQEGDCLWHLADRFLGSPLQWHRIYQHNNRESVIKQTGRGIKNADLIYPGQVLYIPLIADLPQPPPKKKRQKPKPKRLDREAHKMTAPFAAAFYLNEFPKMVYEDPSVRATLSLSGIIAVRLADNKPLIHAGNRGLETQFTSEAENVVHQLFLQDARVAWDTATRKITYECLLASKRSAGSAPATAVGLAVASDTRTPVIRGEIRFPKLSGYLGRHFYAAENVRVVIELEPKVPPVAKGPQATPDLVFKETASYQTTPNYSFAWKIIGEGAVILTVTILTDFLFGIGIFDDAVTIPMGLSRIGYGISRLFVPVVVRSASFYYAHRMAYVGDGMALKAAHGR